MRPLLSLFSCAACGSTNDASLATDNSATDNSTTDNSATDDSAVADSAADDSAIDDTASEDATTTEADTAAESTGEDVSSTFLVEVWADNWMAVYVDGELIGEDSVSITTERSFNAESFTFEATYPFTIGIETKDFKETDSGIEYIGQANQQMGDGGLIAQVTNTSTGEVVAVTNSDWSALVVHRAPLNPECVDDPDPDSACIYEISETPAGWPNADFDDSSWDAATEWSAAAVSPKDGYDDIDWDASAAFIWGSDLEIDNTILTRLAVSG